MGKCKNEFAVNCLRAQIFICKGSGQESLPAELKIVLRYLICGELLCKFVRLTQVMILVRLCDANTKLDQLNKHQLINWCQLVVIELRMLKRA